MRARRGWLVGLYAAAGAVWLLTVDALWNLTANMFDLSAFRWWLLTAAGVTTIATAISTGVIRAHFHYARASVGPSTGSTLLMSPSHGGRVDFAGPSQFGNLNTQITVQPPPVPSPATVSVPVGAHNLPAPSMVFVGRDLAVIDATISEAGVVIGQVVHGLGGVGKTELAAHYAHAHSDRYGLRWWITADTPDATTDGLAALMRRLHPLADLSPALDLTAAASWALGWLQTHSGWLLVLDNVEEPDHISDLLGQVRGQGHVLVTTRRDLGGARWTQLGLAPLPLGVLDRAASVELLRRLAADPDEDQADQLAEELGDLPLALEQAGAYVSQNPGLGLVGYRRLLAQYPDQMFAAAGVGGHGDRAVARVWRLTMTTVSAQSPLAQRIIAVLSYLAPDDLPEQILEPLDEEEPTRREALTLLASYSMINRDGGLISTHRLVQAITRATTASRASGVEPQPLTDAVMVLAQATPAEPWTNVDGWPLWRLLLPHIGTVLARLSTNHTNTTALNLANRAATYQQGQGQVQPAMILFERVATDRRRLLGENHPDTLTSRSNLAGAYQSAGRISEAITLFERVLTDRRHMLGEEHPSTLNSRNLLAGAYRSAGRIGEAINLYEQVLTDFQRVLGEEHPDTLTCQHNLAYAYLSAGRAAEAITLYEQLLTDRRQVVREDHPDTLTSRNNLAGAYQSAGRIGDAITVYEQVLTDRRRLLGEDHPDTLASRNNLAYAYESAWRIGDAITLYEEVLADYRRLLGDDHPSTLTCQHNLAGAYRSAGRIGEAITVYEQVLTDRRRLLGEDHPSTLASRNNLAYAYESAGRINDAANLYEQVLTDYQRVLGEDHPSTLTCRHNLAYAYESAGRISDAITLYEQVLLDCRRVLGADHLLTASATANLDKARSARDPPLPVVGPGRFAQPP